MRLRGAFFAIATLAFAVVLQTLVVNWNYLGGARGAYVIRPESVWLIGNYVHYLFFLMLALAVLAITTARTIERSRLGYGFATIRDDELAAEACGVPTLRLKLIATTLSGAFMGMAGAPFPYYIGYVQPAAAFGLDYAVNSIAMPMIGGTTTWIGPLVGAILVAGLQQWATVTISSELGLLVVGLLLVGFVVVAPSGIVGLVRSTFTLLRAPRASPANPNRRTRHERAFARGHQSGQALRRVRGARRHRPVGRARRARRPHRPQRLGQEHAGQLHLRNARQPERHGLLRRRARSTGSRPMSARGAASHAAFSCRARSRASRSPRTSKSRCSTP